MNNKLKLLCAGLLSLVVCNSKAYDDMRVSDYVLQGIVTTALYTDYRQTLDIKNHAGMYEKNVFLGKHPSDAKIRNYFLGAIVANAAITYILPREYRVFWQGAVISVELVTIRNNRSIGLMTMFQF